MIEYKAKKGSSIKGMNHYVITQHEKLSRSHHGNIKKHDKRILKNASKYELRKNMIMSTSITNYIINAKKFLQHMALGFNQTYKNT